MKQKITITLDAELVAFLDTQGNRSEYLNSLLTRQRSVQLKDQMIAALKQDLEDPEYENDVALWDSVAGDGIDASR